MERPERRRKKEPFEFIHLTPGYNPEIPKKRYDDGDCTDCLRGG